MQHLIRLFMSFCIGVLTYEYSQTIGSFSRTFIHLASHEHLSLLVFTVYICFTHRDLLALPVVLNVDMLVLWVEAALVLLLTQTPLPVQLAVRHPRLIVVTAYLKLLLFISLMSRGRTEGKHKSNQSPMTEAAHSLSEKSAVLPRSGPTVDRTNWGALCTAT